MSKKRPKRVDVRSAMEGQWAAKRQKFYASGAPLSLLFLGIFVIISGLVITCDIQTPKELWRGNWPELQRLLQATALMLVLSLALGLYIAAYQPRIVQNHLRGGVLLTTLVIMITVVRLGVTNQLSPYLIVVPVMIMAIMMTIAYSQRFALGITSFLALVSVLALQMEQINPEIIEQPLSANLELLKQPFAVLLTTGSGMCVSILFLKEIRTRSKLIEVCGLAGVVVFAMVWLTGWWQGSLDRADILMHGLKAGGGAISIGFIMQGLLPIIERLFRTATSLTLLDYSEANKPLLERLAVEAPGTFNHSWQIGMLSEAAAKAIGANGLLCRVGSYYHDIGKLNKPRYFVENQGECLNQHKELAPTLSRMIIIGHVKDGLELAREYKLPRVLHQFVASHHGTTLVEYFYHEATKNNSDNGRTVTEADFRYPGPKPSSKEAAIVMIADAVESATRAMQDPTPNRIENVVQELGMKRLRDDQFDDCDLSMRELHLIENSLVKSLCGMYHGRIAYPRQEKSEKRKAPAAGVKTGV